MLQTRILTALAMLAVLLPALLAASRLPFLVVTLVLVGAAGWEWARLNGVPAMPAWAAGIATVALALWLGWYPSPGGACTGCDSAATVWLIGGAVALSLGPTGWRRWPQALRLMLGPVLLALAWLALARAYDVGVNFLLSIMSLVWVADIAAYFGGRMFGRRKLAPTISPGKTWEGVAAGVVGVWLLALAWVWLESRFEAASPSLYAVLAARYGIAATATLLCLLAGMSVVGDLFESLVKRAAGAKDSSRLLPGHGGVLDRIDALLPVVPMAMAVALR